MLSFIFTRRQPGQTPFDDKSPKADSLPLVVMGRWAFIRLINLFSPFFLGKQQYHYMFEASEDLALNWGFYSCMTISLEKKFSFLFHII